MAKPTKEMEEEPRGDLPPRPPDEVAPPDPDARKAFESREDYRGFKVPRFEMPSGLSLPQRRAWRKDADKRIDAFKKAIDERENVAAKAGREGLRATQFLRETVGGLKKSTKEMGKEAFKEVEGLRELGATVGPAVKEVAEDIVLAKPRAKAALYSDPEGAKEFGRAVLAGDRPAIRKLSEEASKSAMEPFATGGEAVLGGLAAEEGKYGEAAMYGGMLLLPGVLSTLGGKMSKGWLKSAAEAGEEIPDEAAKKMNDLSKRVEAGEVTDDMQIRREIAMIEDDHAADYYGGSPSEEMGRIQEDNFGPAGGGTPGGGRSVDERLAAEGIPVRMPAGSGIPRNADALMRNAINSFEFFGSGLGGPTKLYRVSQPNLPGGFSYMEASSPEALEQLLLTNGELFEEFMDAGGILDATKGGRRGEISDFISEASPEESARYFDLKGGGGGGTPGGGGAAAFKADQRAQRESSNLFGTRTYEAVPTSPKFGLKDQGHHNVVEDLGPLLPEDINLLEDTQRKYNLNETELRQLRDEYVAYGYDDFPGRSARGFEEIDIPDDITTPSFEELQQKFGRIGEPNEPRFGDPNELEMLKEAYRRAAGKKQQMDIAANRIRGSRSPIVQGAPDTFPGPEPEGTSRAVRRSPRRERPKKKE